MEKFEGYLDNEKLRTEHILAKYHRNRNTDVARLEINEVFEIIFNGDFDKYIKLSTQKKERIFFEIADTIAARKIALKKDFVPQEELDRLFRVYFQPVLIGIFRVKKIIGNLSDELCKRVWLSIAVNEKTNGDFLIFLKERADSIVKLFLDEMLLGLNDDDKLKIRQGFILKKNIATKKEFELALDGFKKGVLDTKVLTLLKNDLEASFLLLKKTYGIRIENYLRNGRISINDVFTELKKRYGNGTRGQIVGKKEDAFLWDELCVIMDDLLFDVYVNSLPSKWNIKERKSRIGHLNGFVKEILSKLLAKRVCIGQLTDDGDFNKKMTEEVNGMKGKIESKIIHEDKLTKPLESICSQGLHGWLEKEIEGELWRFLGLNLTKRWREELVGYLKSKADFLNEEDVIEVFSQFYSKKLPEVLRQKSFTYQGYAAAKAWLKKMLFYELDTSKDKPYLPQENIEKNSRPLVGDWRGVDKREVVIKHWTPKERIIANLLILEGFSNKEICFFTQLLCRESDDLGGLYDFIGKDVVGIIHGLPKNGNSLTQFSSLYVEEVNSILSSSNGTPFSKLHPLLDDYLIHKLESSSSDLEEQALGFLVEITMLLSMNDSALKKHQDGLVVQLGETLIRILQDRGQSRLSNFIQISTKVFGTDALKRCFCEEGESPTERATLLVRDFKAVWRTLEAELDNVKDVKKLEVVSEGASKMAWKRLKEKHQHEGKSKRYRTR